MTTVSFSSMAAIERITSSERWVCARHREQSQHDCCGPVFVAHGDPHCGGGNQSRYAETYANKGSKLRRHALGRRI
jgi:hypothetical protein